jgi:uncharacterized membrane protein YbhN (UPF0104 family)
MVAALKWRMLMGPSVELSAKKVFEAQFSGLMGNISPLGMIGGDIVRAGVVIRECGRAATVTLASIIDRVVDTTALLVLMLIGLLLIPGSADVIGTLLEGRLILFATGLVIVAVALVLVWRTTIARFTRVREATRIFIEQPWLIVRALLLSVLVQGSLVWASAFIGRAVGVECSFSAWLIAWPASKLIAYLPISIAGLGVRESALIALLRPFGGEPGSVMAAGLLWQLMFVGGAVGGWLGWSVLPGLASSAPGRSQARCGGLSSGRRAS